MRPDTAEQAQESQRSVASTNRRALELDPFLSLEHALCAGLSFDSNDNDWKHPIETWHP
jgi:hypothetical protein